jgi:hypothetical protein
MRVLVCGGRFFNDRAMLFRTLDAIHADGAQIDVVIEGEARGADLLAAAWASSRGVALAPFPADWTTYGLGAGPIRNRQMLIEGKPDLVVCFPGGSGTADMKKQALRAGVRVLEVP